MAMKRVIIELKVESAVKAGEFYRNELELFEYDHHFSERNYFLTYRENNSIIIQLTEAKADRAAVVFHQLHNTDLSLHKLGFGPIYPS